MSDNNSTKLDIDPRLPDPYGRIRRIRSALNPQCSVRKSIWCDHIISMKMQGVPDRRIEEWLIERGPEYRISLATIWRNFDATKLQIKLPYTEEQLAKWGGRIDLDAIRELGGQILAQRSRVDLMQRAEQERQRKEPTYFDKRLNRARELLFKMLMEYQQLTKLDPEQLSEEEQMKELERATRGEVNENAAKVLTDLILRGDLRVGVHE